MPLPRISFAIVLATLVPSGASAAAAGHAAREMLKEISFQPPPGETMSAATPSATAVADDAPIILPAVEVSESLTRAGRAVVEAIAQKRRLASPALLKTNRAEILFPPSLDYGYELGPMMSRTAPGGIRVSVTLLRIRW